METFKFDTDAYLKRINYKKEVNVSIESLRELHYAQLFTIPFENFDIVLGRGISLEPNKLFDKLVNHPRGGYCFELNGLFLMALQSFGFEARGLLGRVHVSGTPSGKGHQFTLVTLNGEQWITDVGFGGGTMQAPIPLMLDQPVSMFQQTFRLIEARPYGTMLQKQVNGEWQNQYSFTLNHIFPNDIAYGNHYTSTSPDSFFFQSRVAALPTPNGTNTLRGYTLGRMVGGEKIEEELHEDQNYLEALEKYFGIKLDASINDFKPID